ncbi:MAG: mechanosensitive ion channel [Chloroflexi bacterium]|nr:mechanosensitive ion channel [Chloroflexota bacterium]
MPTNGDVLSVLRNWEQVNLTRVALNVGAAWLLIFLSEKGLHTLAARVPGRIRHYILPSVPVVRLAVLVTALVLIVPLIIHPTTENILAILGASALALGFAFRDCVSSIMAGIVSIYEHPYRPGDRVSIERTYGEVPLVGMRALRVTTPDDNLVVIPHSKIWNSIYNANDGKRTLMTVTDFYLHPTHDAALARQTLYDVALTSRFLDLAQPILSTVAERPWGTDYRLKAFPLDSGDQFEFTSDLTVRGQAALGQRGLLPAAAQAAVPDA